MPSSSATCLYTLERNLTNATSAARSFHLISIWRLICESTLVRSLSLVYTQDATRDLTRSRTCTPISRLTILTIQTMLICRWFILQCRVRLDLSTRVILVSIQHLGQIFVTHLKKTRQQRGKRTLKLTMTRSISKYQRSCVRTTAIFSRYIMRRTTWTSITSHLKGQVNYSNNTRQYRSKTALSVTHSIFTDLNGLVLRLYLIRMERVSMIRCWGR